jgi:hypothetical protein
MRVNAWDKWPNHMELGPHPHIFPHCGEFGGGVSVPGRRPAVRHILQGDQG